MYHIQHIGTMVMLKICKHTFYANLKIDAIYAFYPESFCDKNLAIRKVFNFSDSAYNLELTQSDRTKPEHRDHQRGRAV